MKTAATPGDACQEPNAGCTRPWWTKCDDGIKRCFNHTSTWWWANKAPTHKGVAETRKAMQAWHEWCQETKSRGRGRAASPECSVQWCHNPVNSRGWCVNHYQRWRRHGTALKLRTAFGTMVTERTVARLIRGLRTPDQLGFNETDTKWLRARYLVEDFLDFTETAA